MEPMTARQIADAVDGVWLNPRENAPAVAAVCTDSRKLTPGCLFLPWVGERFDGHDFIDAARAPARRDASAPAYRKSSGRTNFTSRSRTPGWPSRPWPPPTGTSFPSR